VNLSNEDIQDILSLLDSLPYSEFTLETSRFTLRLRRSAEGGWTQETQVTSRPVVADPAARAAQADGPAPADGPASSRVSPSPGAPSARGAPPSSEPGPDLSDIVTPLPGTFYRAPQPGAPPFVDTGGLVEPGTVVAIIETMKLMNPVYAGTSGTVTQICLADGQFAEQGTVLMRVSAGAG
jgi:acetyl-CoA carboxylase biotin carboxyl carrier protein